MLRSGTTFDDNGHVVADVTSRYVITDGPTAAESSDDILYYLGVAADNSWMIRKRTISAGTERFTIGRTDGATAYLPANRVSLTYDRTPIF